MLFIGFVAGCLTLYALLWISDRSMIKLIKQVKRPEDAVASVSAVVLWNEQEQEWSWIERERSGLGWHLCGKNGAWLEERRKCKNGAD